MRHLRFVFGLVVAAIGGYAVIAGTRSLVDVVRGSMHSPSALAAGLIGPAIFFGAALILFRLAYRNLFWERYVSRFRGAYASISTAPTKER